VAPGASDAGDGEHRCQNSQTDACPRTDTTLFTVRMAGSVLYQIWLCPEHTRLEWNDVASDAGDGDGER
jgi:hypothetical protein